MTDKSITELIDEAMEHVPERVIRNAEKHGTKLVICERDGTIRKITPQEARARLKESKSTQD